MTDHQIITLLKPKLYVTDDNVVNLYGIFMCSLHVKNADIIVITMLNSSYKKWKTIGRSPCNTKGTHKRIYTLWQFYTTRILTYGPGIGRTKQLLRIIQMNKLSTIMEKTRKGRIRNGNVKCLCKIGNMKSWLRKRSETITSPEQIEADL